MTIHVKNGSIETRISRRGFVAGAAGLTFAFTLGGLGRLPEAIGATGATKFNAWVSIGADNTVTILCPAAEMGQGVLTSLPLILAEELDADWAKVRQEWAPPIPKIYGNPHPVLRGVMATVGSVSVPGYYMPLRMAGAQARKVLVDAAAEKWNVLASELETSDSTVTHKKSGRSMTYGEIIQFAKVPAEPPKVSEADLKKPSQFKLVGRADIGRVDVPSKTNGSAVYGIDVQVPGIVHAAVLEAPMDGVKPKVLNLDEVTKIKGVTKVIPLPFGVAVLGDTVEATFKGRNALKVEWDTSKAIAAHTDSEKAKAEYAAKGKDPNVKSLDAYKVGDADSALKGAAKVMEGTYWSEYTYHAQMEPMNCIARVADDGKSAEVWTGIQSAALGAFIASKVLKTTPDKVRIHQHLLGGGYGRRVYPDAVVQAVVIAKVSKQTVKLLLTREDDLAAARPRPMTHHVIKAGLDADNKIVGWHHRLVAENVDAVAVPPRFEATGGKDYIGWRGLDTAFYGIPHVHAEGVREIRGMRVHAWRAIGSGYNKFASESFLDEVAHATGKDSLAIRLELTEGHPRANACLKAVAEMCEWGRKRPDGRALGIAFSDYHDTLSAGAAEISVDRETGKIKVHDFWIAVDPGLAVQPTNVHAQIESAVVYGLSAALIEELTVKGGAIQQSNFNDYQVLRMSDMPQIHTKLLVTDNPPTGMGEIGVITVAPAIANALFILTGKRMRHLPMTAERVKAALKA